MEIHKAQIAREDDKAILKLNVGEKNLEIVLTEDKPNEVKGVFNSILTELKKGEFNFELEDSDQDLYHHISREYITQLNSELSSIYKELTDYELTEEEEEEE